MQSPLQLANLENLSWCKNFNINNENNLFFEELIEKLERIFLHSVEQGKLKQFIHEYEKIANIMIKELPGEPVLKSIMDYAFRRLVNMYSYLRQRRNSSLDFLKDNDSIVEWKLEERMLSRAIEQASRMEQSRVRNEDFDIKRSPELLRWVYKNYWPIVRKFSGIMAMPIIAAHIRCVSSDVEGDIYKNRFQYHKFGNHHYDEDLYSLPLIIYLSDVTENCGPFEFIDGSDKFDQKYVLRAFHQALNHDCKISSLHDSSFSVLTRLPSVFRGGDVIGNLHASDAFERLGPVSVTGGAGTAVMFHGFNLIHAGGFPLEGCRKSLFINVRFPVSKVVAGFRNMKMKKYRNF